MCRQTGHRNLLKKTKIEIVNNTDQCFTTLGDIDIHANHLYFVTKDMTITGLKSNKFFINLSQGC